MDVHDLKYAAWDSQRYLAAAHATNSSFAAQAPYCWRLLVPQLISIPPGSPEGNFYILTIFSLFSTCLFLALYCRSLNLGSWEMYAVVLLFLFSRWTTGYLLFDYALVDGPAFAFIVLILWLTERRASLPLILAAVVVGTLVKEQVLLAAMYSSIAIFFRRRREQESLLPALVPLGSFLLVEFLLRIIIHPVNDYSLLREVAERFSSQQPVGYFHYSPAMLVGFAYDITIGTWAASVPLIAYGIWDGLKTSSFGWKHSAYIALAYGQLLAAWNIERLTIYAFPILLIVAVASVSRLSQDRQRLKHMLLGSTVALQLLVYVRALLNMNGYSVAGVRHVLTSFLSHVL